MESYGDFFVNLAYALIIVLVTTLIMYVLVSIGYYKIFKKAKMDHPLFRAFIPYYNTWSLVELSGCHWWYFLVLISNLVITINDNSLMNGSGNSIFVLLSTLLSIAIIYVNFCINYNIAKKFKQTAIFAIGMTFLPFIFYLILGFSKKYEYDESILVNPWGCYDFQNKAKDQKKVVRYCSECGSEMSGNFCPKCGKKGE